MRSKTSAVLTAVVLTLGAWGLATAEDAAPAAPAAAAPAAAPAKPDDNVTRVLKLADPDIEALKKLDASKIDFKKESLETRTMAVMALNELLTRHGERARRRVTLLEDYIQLKNLQDALAEDASVVPEAPSRTLEDALKMSVAFVKSPLGAEGGYDRQVKGVKPETLQRVFQSYYVLVEKNWGEVQYRRFRVQELASFLDSKKQLNSFVTWARDETARQKEERAKAAAENREKQKAEDAIARGKRIEQYDKRKQEETDRYMRRLEYANEHDGVGNYGPENNNYYYSGW